MPKLYIDMTHMNRRQSGIERVTNDLFGTPGAFDRFHPNLVRGGGGKLEMLISQQMTLPTLALANPNAAFIFPGFPPTFLFSSWAISRTIFYVHDLFFLTRAEHANRAGRLYYRPVFEAAVRKLGFFFTNSDQTTRELKNFCRADAEIVRLRPPVRNVFDLKPVALRPFASVGPTRFVALGTVEPRKNLQSALSIVKAFAEKSGRPAELHVVGRRGWGGDYEALSRHGSVKLHGALEANEVRKVVEAADFFINTSHDEGLGLPLLEVQYSGIPVIAPRRPIFEEVLGASGLLVNIDSAASAADRILTESLVPDWFERQHRAALSNIERWNKTAGEDTLNASALISTLLARCGA